ncbi:MAG: hypothetical protein H6607_09500 [Flavobacteriales bacterium]|nr:hypothetical protein [Flavobacteriales bacterium]
MRPIVWVIPFLLLASCGKKYSAKEFYNEVQNRNSSFCQKTENGKIVHYVQHRPKEFMALLNLRGKSFDKHRLDSFKNLYDDGLYFNIKIGTSEPNVEILKYNLQDQTEYFKRLEYFSSGFVSDVYLVDGKDTACCNGNHFERTFGLEPEINIQCYFKPTFKPSKKSVIIINNRAFFNQGEFASIPLPKSVFDRNSYKIKAESI